MMNGFAGWVRLCLVMLEEVESDYCRFIMPDNVRLEQVRLELGSEYP